MDAQVEKKKRVITRKPKEPMTKEAIETKIKQLEKQKRLIDLDIEKLKIELEFAE